jgi:hypothetical protein
MNTITYNQFATKFWNKNQDLKTSKKVKKELEKISNVVIEHFGKLCAGYQFDFDSFSEIVFINECYSNRPLQTKRVYK